MDEDFPKRKGFELETLSVAQGIFCDITGTLVSYKKNSDEVDIDEDVVAFLRYIRDVRQRPVTLCSRVQDNALTPFALREEFGFVVGKAIYRSQIMEVLIDNNPDEYLYAQHKFGPEALKGFSKMPLEKQHSISDILTADKSTAPTHQPDDFEQ